MDDKERVRAPLSAGKIFNAILNGLIIGGAGGVMCWFVMQPDQLKPDKVPILFLISFLISFFFQFLLLLPEKRKVTEEQILLKVYQILALLLTVALGARLAFGSLLN